MRNSSLVEWWCAEDLSGLNLSPKFRDVFDTSVEEQSIRAEAIPEGVVDCIEERMPA